MQTSISVKGEGVPLEMMVFHGALEDSLRCIAEIGYDGVELYLFSAETEEANTVKTLLKRYGLRAGIVVALFDLITTDVIMGHPDAHKRREFLDRAVHHLRLAAELGAGVPIGFTRGYVRKGTSESDVEGWFFDALSHYIKLAEEFGVTLLIEPINRYEINYINRVEEALRVLDTFRSPKLKLLLDTFHMNIEEASISNAIRTAGDRIGHVHFVDSNRWPPGYGHIDLKEVYAQLLEVGYDGFLGVEALPKPSPEIGARAGLAYMRSIASIFHT